MGLLNVKPRELQRVINEKVKPEERRAGSEMNYWYRLDDKRLFRVTTPKVHQGSSVPTGTLHQIRSSLKLSTNEFADLVRCPMSGSDYEALIRKKVEEQRL